MDDQRLPIGSQHLENAPWNQEQFEKQVKVEMILIPVWIKDEQIHVSFQLEFTEYGNIIEVKILEYQYPVFPENWNEDIKFYLEENSEKPIKLLN